MFSDFAKVIVALNRVSKVTFGFRHRLGKIISENFGYLSLRRILEKFSSGVELRLWRKSTM